MGTDSHLLLGTSYFVILRAMAWSEMQKICIQIRAKDTKGSQHETDRGGPSVWVIPAIQIVSVGGVDTPVLGASSWFRDHTIWVGDGARKQIPIAVSQLCATYIHVGNSEQLLWFHPTGGPGPSIWHPSAWVSEQHRQHHAPLTCSAPNDFNLRDCEYSMGSCVFNLFFTTRMKVSWVSWLWTL